MRKICAFLLVMLCIVGALSIPSMGAEEAITASCVGLQAKSAISEDGYTGTAQSVLLYEMGTGTMVYAHQPDSVVEPLGMVKIMAAIVALEQGTLTDRVTVTAEMLADVPSNASKLKLKTDDRLSVRDLIYAIVMTNYDDAAVILAYHISGSQENFVALMNAKATEIGCTNTHFVNAHGIKADGQYSTARDLAIITEYALGNSDFVRMFKSKSYELPSTVSCDQSLTTSNGMQDDGNNYYDKRVTGGKAIRVSQKGYMICTAKNGNVEYLCVLIGISDTTSSKTKTYKETTALLKNGFDNFSLQRVMGAEQSYGMYDVADGENAVVTGPEADVYAMLPLKCDTSKLSLQDVPDETALSAPLAQGTEVGVMQVCYDGKIVKQISLTARHDVATVGTTIANASATGKIIWKTVKWILLIVFGCAVVLMAVFITIRQINIIRHNKKRRYARRRVREENR